MNKLIFFTIKFVFAIAILWFLSYTSKLDFKLLKNLFYSIPLLIGILLIYFIVVLVSAWRWYQLNKAQNIKLSFRQTIIPTYLGIAFNNLLPGGIGGDFFRGYFLFKHIPDKRSAIMLSILFDRITGLMGILIAAGFVMLLHLNLFAHHTDTFYFILCSLSLCLGGLLLFFASTLLPKKIGLSQWLSQRFSHKRWLTPLLSLLDAVRIYRHSKLVIIKCLWASILVQILIVTTCMLIAKTMHFPSISFIDYMIATAVTQIVNLIPIAPGGFGIGEAAFANILLFLNPGINATYATIFLAYRFLGILAYLPGLFVFAVDSNLLKTDPLITQE